VDGWLLIGDVTDEAVNRVRACGRPHVVLGGHRCRQPIHAVDVDHRQAGWLAGRHLAALGHRRVGFLGGTMRYPYQIDAREGFRAAVREFGLDADGALMQIQRIEQRTMGADRLVAALLALQPRPTAIVAAEPGLTSSALAVLRQRNVQVPREMSLVSLEQGEITQPVLDITIVDLPYFQMGHEGVTLLKRQAARPSNPPKQLLIPPSVVEGWSCCPPLGTDAHNAAGAKQA
jgi:LacI family transcriptional regulator